jgi:ribosomal protein S18 acetylase RimI-like enzyme
MGVTPIEIERCPVGDRPETLKVLCWQLGQSQRTELVAQILGDERRGAIDLSELWLARESGVIVGAILAQVYPGRTAAIWPPEVCLPGLNPWRSRAGLRNQIASDLVHQVVTALGHSGVRVVQALLDLNGKDRQAADLANGGLPRVTELIYLSRSVNLPSKLPEDRLERRNLDLDWSGYDQWNAARFRLVLEATYVDSLDMPELTGARTLEDILASHQATGHYLPHLWQLGELPDEPAAAAILLMLDRPERDSLEVAYLGLTPSARGRGLGKATIERAINHASVSHKQVELAVDARNIPARKLYAKTGFESQTRRSVHLRTFLGEA